MLEKIEQQISDMLRNNKALSNQIEDNKQKEEQLLDEVFIDLISVLDTFSREEKVIEDHDWNKSEDSQKAIKRLLLTSSLRHPKIFVKEFSDFLMSCHQHCLGVNLLVQR